MGYACHAMQTGRVSRSGRAAILFAATIAAASGSHEITTVGDRATEVSVAFESEITLLQIVVSLAIGLVVFLCVLWSSVIADAIVYKVRKVAVHSLRMVLRLGLWLTDDFGTDIPAARPAPWWRDEAPATPSHAVVAGSSVYSGAIPLESFLVREGVGHRHAQADIDAGAALRAAPGGPSKLDVGTQTCVTYTYVKGAATCRFDYRSNSGGVFRGDALIPASIGDALHGSGRVLTARPFASFE